jgi:hypothetical protein
MIDNIKREVESHNIGRGKLTACCKRVEKLSNKLRPFFDIVTICVQNTEYASLAWGAIRLVFQASVPQAFYIYFNISQLGDHYITFLEKLTIMFEKMAQNLPAYEEYVVKLQFRAQKYGRKPHPRLLKALAYIYVDIIQFCLDACRLFSAGKNGTYDLEHYSLF